MSVYVTHRRKDTGVQSYFSTSSVILTPTSMAIRLVWCRQHLRWTRVQWQLVTFSDESSFKICPRYVPFYMMPTRIRFESHRTCSVVPLLDAQYSLQIWRNCNWRSRRNGLPYHGQRYGTLRIQWERALYEYDAHGGPHTHY